MGKLKVRVTNSQWAGEGLVLTGGTHELDTSDLTDEQVAALGAAAAATAGVEVVDLEHQHLVLLPLRHVDVLQHECRSAKTQPGETGIAPLDREAELGEKRQRLLEVGPRGHEGNERGGVSHRRHRHLASDLRYTFSITSGITGGSPLAILSTLSMPSITSPHTVY